MMIDERYAESCMECPVDARIEREGRPFCTLFKTFLAFDKVKKYIIRCTECLKLKNKGSEYKGLE